MEEGLNFMEDILRKLKLNKKIIACGDFNIDILTDTSNKHNLLSINS